MLQSYMSAPNTEEVKSNTTGNETHGVSSRETEYVRNAASISSAPPPTTEAVATNVKDALNPLTKRFKKLCDLMKEFKRDSPRGSEETSRLAQSPSRLLGNKFNGLLFLLCPVLFLQIFSKICRDKYSNFH